MPVKLIFAAAVFLRLVSCSVLAEGNVHGVVFNDLNQNGRRDNGEPGIANVAVSNGADLTLTKTDGSYEIAEGHRIFFIKPKNWRTPATDQNLPLFYRNVSAETSTAAATFDFPLTSADEPDTFQIIATTDTQPGTDKEVDYLNRTIAGPLARHHEFAFGVTLGDVVNDRHDLYSGVNAAMGRIGIPWYFVPGNHDLNLDATEETKSMVSFESAYGPSTYAFHYGKVLFVALNDIRYPVMPGGFRYVGGLSEDQFRFLQNLLHVAPSDELIVLLMHIPLFNEPGAEVFRVADRTRLFDLLKDRPHTFSISGHTHYQRHVFFSKAEGWLGDQPHHQYNVAAADGGFWGGPPDVNGIPISTMWDGTPHGYGVITFKGTEVQTEFRAARFPADYQIGLHVPETIRTGQSFIPIFANVFDGHDGWTVEIRIDDDPWKPMKRTLTWDPAYAQAYLAQDKLPTPLKGLRLPEPVNCYHLWKSTFPSDLRAGDHVVEVRARNPDEKEYHAKQNVKVFP